MLKLQVREAFNIPDNDPHFSPSMARGIDVENLDRHSDSPDQSQGDADMDAIEVQNFQHVLHNKIVIFSNLNRCPPRPVCSESRSSLSRVILRILRQWTFLPV